MATMVEQDSMIQAAVAEFREEASITKRVLDRVPGDKLSWKPHEKSMSLGQLALHVATVPGSLARILQQDSFDAAKASFVPAQPKNLEEIFAACDQSMRAAEQFLSELTPQQARPPGPVQTGVFDGQPGPAHAMTERTASAHVRAQ